VAGHVPDRVARDRILAMLDMPVKVIRLEVPVVELERRAAADPTSGRREDLAASRAQAATGSTGVEDATVRNDRPLRETALEIIGLLGWA
jgi:hypothetical protein